MKRLLLAVPLVAVLAAPAHGATLLRLDGIGPLSMGMSRTAALDTNWLSNRHSGCPLGGKPYPIDYDIEGAEAPAGLKDATAEFTNGVLSNLAFTGGVRTATGVVPGKTTWASMVKRYRDAGFKVSSHYLDTFGGTFVNVKRKGKQVIGGFAQGKVVTSIGVPYVPVCE